LAQFLGMLYSKDAHRLREVCAEGYAEVGEHVLCGGAAVCEGDAAALSAGWMRNERVLRTELGLAEDAPPSLLVLRAYRRWGEEYIEHIEGPVICAVLDGRKGRLLLSSDRMGEAGGVFYRVQGKSVIFAGHPEQLLRADGARARVDEDGWREIFGLGPARTPGRTPFADICQLPAGHMLLADRDGVRIRCFFSLQARPHEHTAGQTIEKVRELTEQAVQSAARFEPAAMLSGGLDSTVLTALLCRNVRRPVHTFSVDYEENGRYFRQNSYQAEPDAPYVERAVRELGCVHTRVVIGAGQLADSLEDAMAARGWPGMADIDASLLIFSRRMAGSASFAVSGECADEVFGGYPWFHREALRDGDCFPWSGSLKLRERILGRERAKRLHLEEYVRDCWQSALNRQPALPGEAGVQARLRQLQGVCFEYFMTNLQERACAMGQAAGLTVLTPFCDERLVEYVYNVPWEIKNMGGREKGLLREAMRGVLSDELLLRKKSPYPKTHHPDYSTRVREMMEEVLNDPASPVLGMIDREEVRRLTRETLAPSHTPWFGQLMTGVQMLAYLIQINQWMRQWGIEGL